MNCDYLIVGQGIAGTVLAFELMERGATIQIIDNGSRSNSSRVAAGLFNPIVFKRITFSWRAEECLEEMHRFYRKQEERFNSSFFHPIDMHRIHGGDPERISWAEHQQNPAFATYLGASVSSEEKPWLNQRFGAARLLNAGFVDTRTWLDEASHYFEKNGLRQQTSFDYSALELLNEGVRYKDIEAKKIIFCEGAQALKNPWFGHLPFNLAKGDVLVIDAPEVKQEIFNGGVFGVPLGDGKFRVGATYIWNFPDELPTEKGRAEIEEKLRYILNVPFKVISHTAGIRPTIRDRRPLLGKHATLHQLGIFNGLGTKGVMMAPVLAKEFADFLCDGKALSSEVDIARFA